MIRAGLCALALVLASGCAVGPAESGRCTLIGCDDGLRVDFTFRDRGAYVFDLIIDGNKTICRATLPLTDPPPTPCDRPGVFLTLSGSKLPADQQSLGGLSIASTTVRQILLRITRNGEAVGTLDKTVDYRVTPGPNGPQCEPKECRQATLTL